MKALFLLLTMSVSVSSFASESCKLIDSHDQAYMRCFCMVYEVSCENEPDKEVYVGDTTAVNCGDKKDVLIGECEIGSKIELPADVQLLLGKKMGPGVGVQITGKDRVID